MGGMVLERVYGRELWCDRKMGEVEVGDNISH